MSREKVLENLEHKILLTPAEAAAVTGVSENLIRELCRYKVIPCLTSNKASTPAYKIGRVALLAWIDKMCNHHINLVDLINEAKDLRGQKLSEPERRAHERKMRSLRKHMEYKHITRCKRLHMPEVREKGANEKGKW